MRSVQLSILVLFILLVPADAQDLPSILEAHYQAASQEKMTKVESIITTGKNNFASAGFELSFKISQLRPDKLRVEENYPGAKVIQTYNGQTAWKYAPNMGVPVPVEITGEELQTLLGQMQFEDPLWNYAEKGVDLELVKSDSRDMYHLLYRKADGMTLHFFIDRDSHLISAIRSKQVLRANETEIEVKMEAYKKTRGIPFARRIITSMNGQVLTTMEIQKVELNRPLDPGLFEKPPVK